ncbi:SH3 domain-containing protein [Streptomyces sp. HU2014]|uniref:SH3 domain-containing protein n=1 Tax=Streptomyces albireticuli TaxID=1940 RepID=A0A1Z2LCQ6_9ACTN|nr:MULTISPECIES: SH3 domain-containing protein [Streptomyces]ARZ72084.1 hypothetical protein SMD11_6508 [Streptomyces albireticuli]UQI45468.1 SH3 domain-containing protein [Streptomyces sp. HU2014]
MTQTLVARGMAVSVAALTGAVLAAGPAQSAPVPARPSGTVVSVSGVNERHFPSTDSSVRSTLLRGVKVGLRCKVRAQNIGGNNVWYLLRDRATWVNSAYITPAGAVPLCKDVNRGVPENAPKTRAAMG